MKKIGAALVLGCALLVTGIAGATTGRTGAGNRLFAAPPIVWGVADDASKYADDGGSWFYGQLKGANLTVNRWTLAWNPASPSAITELPFFVRAAPKAQAAGIRIELALYSTEAGSHDPAGFCAWAALVAHTARAYGIHDFIVWNEPNTRLYWTPQKDASGNDVAASDYEALLATCYDTIHSADPSANVIGMGLSPRASTSDSNEPLPFIRDVGKAYQASGRTKPIMDQLSIHPYPNPSVPTDSPDVGYQATFRFGIPNLDRVKQAVYDAFNGTGQPTTLNGLTFVIDEVGWQTDTTQYSQYVNPENVAVVSEQTQADYLKKMATKYFACDPTVTMVNLFLLVDEKYRNGKDENGKVVGGGWQSGLETAGGQGVSQPKSSYAQVGPVFGQGRAACAGAQITWSPTGSSGGGAGGGTGGSTTSSSGTAGDPDGVISPEAQADLAAAVASLGTQQAALPPLNDTTTTTLGVLYKATLSQVLSRFSSPFPLNYGVTLWYCAKVSGCDPGSLANAAFKTSVRVVSAASAVRPISLTTAKATAPAGKAPTLVFKNASKKAKLKAGTYVLSIVAQNATDPTKKYAIAIKLRSVVHTAVAKAKHKKKKK